MREQNRVFRCSLKESIRQKKYLFYILVCVCAVAVLLYESNLVKMDMATAQTSRKDDTFFLRGLTEAILGKSFPDFNKDAEHIHDTDTRKLHVHNTKSQKHIVYTNTKSLDNRRKLARQKHVSRTITASDDPKWLPLDGKNHDDDFVYAAYYDDVECIAFVRVLVAVVRRGVNESVKCVYFSRDDLYQPLGVTEGHLSSYRHWTGQRFNGAFAKCPLIKHHPFPFAVSVVKNYDAVNDVTSHNNDVTSVLEVHYGVRRLANDGSDVAREEEEGGERGGNEGESGFRWNITKCFPCLHRYQDTVQLIQQVEIGRTLGIQRFVFYNLSIINRDVDRVLQYYQQEGVVEVLDWHYPEPMRRSAYFNQLLAIQDCLYRCLRSTRYLLFGDLDEIAMPRSTSSLLTLLDELFTEQPQCGAFLFLNTFFQPDPLHTPPYQSRPPPPPPPPPRGRIVSLRTRSAKKRPQAKRYKRNMQSSTRTRLKEDPDSVPRYPAKAVRTPSAPGTREKRNSALDRFGSTSVGQSGEIPDAPEDFVARADQERFVQRYHLDMFLIRDRVNEIWVNKRRAKPAVIPSRVEAGQIHRVEVMRGSFNTCSVPIDQGLLHHYRKRVPNSLGVKHFGKDWGYVPDHSLLRLADQILPQIAKVLNRLNLSYLGNG